MDYYNVNAVVGLILAKNVALFCLTYSLFVDLFRTSSIVVYV